MRNASDDEIIQTAHRDYERARDAWSENRSEAEADLRFARLGDQWPRDVVEERDRDSRPMLTFNRLPAFIRQVVNDARQNKPQIKVHPQDSSGDPEVAEIINGLLRNIELISDADVAYDTAIEHAVGQGFGYWRINTAYTQDDGFEQDILVERIANPFTVLGDPASTAVDSSDWNVAFVATTLTHDEFEREFPDAEKIDWEYDFRNCPEGLGADKGTVAVAEYWTREKVRSEIVALSDGSVVKVKELEANPETFHGLEVVGRPREVESWQVTQRLISGAEVLRTVAWPGKFIPIVPVYGDEVIDGSGKRHFRSLIRDAKAPQQMFNYWRTTTTELVALAPKAPWIAEEGTFDCDEKWETAHNASHAFLEYERGRVPPQRQPFTGVPAGALQEALNAADDMKSIIGIYDASLGARSNETSGRAIMARQREGDVSTFHFIDNLNRAIRHSGRVILDLLPKVYSSERMVRVLGEDLGKSVVHIAPTGRPKTVIGDASGALRKVFDIGAGKYDLTVKAGPSFTTMREEHRAMLMEAVQAGGDAVAAVMLPRIARLMDLPDSEQMGAELEARLNPAPAGSDSGMAEALRRLEEENSALRAKLRDRSSELRVKARDTEIDAFDAVTRRLKALETPAPANVMRPPA